MNGRLLFLNLALLAAVGAVAWKVRENYLADRAKQEAFLRRNNGAAPVAPHTPSQPAKPVQAASYLQVAQQMLFAKDRNPNVIIEIEPQAAPPPPPPVPPFPAAYGMIGFGGEVIVLLADNGRQKSFKLGDSVGPFKLSAIKGEELTLEWNGQEFKKTITELKKLGNVASATADAKPTAATTAGNSAPTVQSVARDGMPLLDRVTPKEVYEKVLNDGNGPGINTGGQERGCDPNDKSPAGTVQGGYRKRLTPSPFGTLCAWEPVR